MQRQQNPYAPVIENAATAYDLDPQMMARIARIESGYNPTNRTGSYKGLFQLSDDEFNKYGGGNIYDPQDNANAAARKFAAEARAFKAQYGRDPTATDIYMQHQQGVGGYAAHTANPDAPAWANMASTGEGRQKGAGWARAAVWGNLPDSLKAKYGSVDNVRSRDLIDAWRTKVEGDGAEPMAYAPTGKSMNPMLSANGAYGPGALGAAAAGPDSPNYSGALEGAGAWLMGLDKPAVLAQYLGKQNTPEDYSLVQGADGTMYRVAKRSGQVIPVAAGGAKLPEGVIPKLQEGLDKATALHSVSTQGEHFLKSLQDGTLDLGLVNKGKAFWESALGNSSPQTQELNAFESFRTGAANSILQAAKGTQTEGDAKRAYDEFVNGVAANDNATVHRAIKKLIDVNGKLIASGKTGLDAYGQQYPNAPGLAPFQESYGKMAPFYQQQFPDYQSPASRKGDAAPAYKVIKVH